MEDWMLGGEVSMFEVVFKLPMQVIWLRDPDG